ncbi:MAG TPA: bifunctional diguanylate cyclase/phosphodiesterase [Alteromonas sp.]|nr:histidine kinase [Alteromonadaceae bacterium]MAX42008.1 histidine kinase [Alteromonadaceae bacterium]HBY39508.1 bifunctional diguanylate cyclase/phosphodiesterase [Alteromonas sp.]
MTLSQHDITPDVASLTRRLKREKAARQQAETLLTEKSRELFEALQQSQTNQEKLELALWATQESYWEWHATEDAFLVKSFGLRKKQVKESKHSAIALMAIVHEDDLPTIQFQWSLAVHSGCDDIELTFRVKSVRGDQWMRSRGRVLRRDDNGTAVYIVGTSKDITRQQKAEQSFQLMASAFSSSREPMLVLSDDFTITESNEAFLSLAQLNAKHECEHQPLTAFLQGAKDKLQQLPKLGQLQFDTHLITVSGTTIPVELSLAMFESRQQGSTYLIATIRDISERKQNEERLRELATHDDLTGLKNRLGLNAALKAMTEREEPFALAFIDLDGFKTVNDLAGHDSGDNCLVAVANTLKEVYTGDAEVTRWGGDEFLIAIPGEDEQQCVDQSQALIEALEALSFGVSGNDVRLSASIGVAYFPAHGNCVEALIQNADAAMYQAKTLGKGQVFVYRHGLIESMKEQVTLLTDLHRAIRTRSLDFYLQGKFSSTGKLIGAELLCRWFSPLHGMVSPGTFIPLAEAHGLDGEIGLMALESACEYIAMMEAEGLSVPMSVNISANQLLEPGFANIALSICDEHVVAPQMIEIEITESIFIQDESSALRALTELRNAGFVLSLDDFGSGFSSLSYLRTFQFDVIKIDRSLAKDIHCSTKALSLLSGLVKMLNSLQYKVLVEGVDNLAYIPLMEDMGISAYQGFLFEKPIPYDQFIYKHVHSSITLED